MNEPVLFLGPNAATDETAEWVRREFGNVELGDSRRNRRLLDSLEVVFTHPGQSIPEMMGGWPETKAFYRLLDQPSLSAEVIFNAHCEGTLGRVLASGEEMVLALQDTTSLNFTTRKALKEQGPVGNEKGTGIHLHNTLLVGAHSEHIYGLLGAKFFLREDRKKRKSPKSARNREALEDKESVRWRESYELAYGCQRRLQSQGADNLTMVSVGDREADIYELLLEAQQHCQNGMHLLIRSQHSRLLSDDQQSEHKRLWDAIGALSPAGKMVVKIPKRKGLQVTEVELEVRFEKLELAVPHDRAKYGGFRETLTQITAIEARQVGVPDGIHWKLLTTLPVRNATDAARMVRLYAKRWKIEILHRVLKSGCKVEERQLQSAERLHPMVAIDLVTACYLMGLCGAARENPQADASEWLGAEELEALQGYFQLDPETAPPRLGEVVRLIAKLGGHLGRKGDGPPGAEVLWRGLTKLRVIAEAWGILKPLTKVSG